MKETSRSLTIVLAVLALGGALLATDRCAAVRDLRADAEKANGAARVAEAERLVLEWERHLYKPAGRDLSKTYGELQDAMAQLEGVEHEEAWIWRARVHVDMLQFDEAIALIDAHAGVTREDVRLLNALARGSRYQLARHQSQYVLGDAHMESRLLASLEPQQKAAQSATEGVDLRGSLGERLRGGAPGDYGATQLLPARPEAFTYRGLVRHRIVFAGGAKKEEVLPMLDLALKDFERAKDKAQAIGLSMDAFRCNVAGSHLAYAEQQVAAGGVLEARSSLQSALEHAGTVVAADATHAAALFVLARANHLQGALDRAIVAYELTLKHGNDADAQTRMHYTAALNDLGFAMLGNATKENGERALPLFDRSLALLAPILEAEPASAAGTIRRGAARLGKARAQMAAGQEADEAFKGALEDVDRVATARPEDAVALYDAAEARFWHGLYVAARDKIDPFEPLEPAVAGFGAVLKKQPDHAQARVLRAECRKRSALFRKQAGTEFKPLVIEALADLDAAIEANETYVDAYLSRGELHTIDGNAAAAKEAYEKVAELVPDSKAEMDRRIKALGGG